MPLCPRCLTRAARVELALEHSCADYDATCPRCSRPLLVYVRKLDERGSLSIRSPCGCFYIPTKANP